MAEWKGVHYSDHDMLNMQQEAIRRVRQMQQRARQSLSGGEPVSPSAERPSFPPADKALEGSKNAAGREADAQRQAVASRRAPPAEAASRPASPLGQLGERLGQLIQGTEGEKQGLGDMLSSVIGEHSPAARVLEALGLDNERLLLLGLLLVLLNEKADRTLLIALVYLLL
ncbi:MAG: hypothetical protein HFG27_03735 [Provencibacterium sp.]|jgi:hypothetical protein|nr:hypothetical protein [Provencibacterium sp.]